MSERYERKYVKLRDDYELLFHILSSYAIDRMLWKVSATANPDVLADLTYYAERAMEGVDENVKKAIKSALQHIKMRDSAALQKKIMSNEYTNAEILKMLLMIAGSEPEVVEKELKRRERRYTDFNRFMSD
ncbi:MAG: hypothetical protein RMI45_08675, partial [Ignisphaera sp.]|nr:hypothetical protein [Ignisphaera sp.]